MTNLEGTVCGFESAKELSLYFWVYYAKMIIRESLIKDIQEADNQLLKPLFEIWQVLKKNVNNSASDGPHSIESFFGILDEND
ncbi:MAG: hypothetical protein AAF655_28385, partial [Bacteroidota bacterium]